MEAQISAKSLKEDFRQKVFFGKKVLEGSENHQRRIRPNHGERGRVLTSYHSPLSRDFP